MQTQIKKKPDVFYGGMYIFQWFTFVNFNRFIVYIWWKGSTRGIILFVIIHEIVWVIGRYKRGNRLRGSQYPIALKLMVVPNYMWFFDHIVASDSFSCSRGQGHMWGPPARLHLPVALRRRTTCQRDAPAILAIYVSVLEGGSLAFQMANDCR